MKTLAIFSSILVLAACSKQQQQPVEEPQPVVEQVAVSERDVADQSATAPEVSRDPAMATNTGAATSNADRTRTDATGSSASTTAGSTTAASTTSANTTATPSPGAAPDNTDVNKRDRRADALTPVDQGNNETDLKITQEIRQILMKDSSLSFTAKNVKVITASGKVTLRGPVKSAQERATIEAAAKRVAGNLQVDNQLEVK